MPPLRNILEPLAAAAIGVASGYYIFQPSFAQLAEERRRVATSPPPK